MKKISVCDASYSKIIKVAFESNLTIDDAVYFLLYGENKKAEDKSADISEKVIYTLKNINEGTVRDINTLVRSHKAHELRYVMEEMEKNGVLKIRKEKAKNGKIEVLYSISD
jgi:hypothetical protein